MRFINAYGVQETASSEERCEFYSLLDQEVQFCLNSGIYMCMELDTNAKVGLIIENNPQEIISPNGRLLIDIIQRNNLILVNGTSKKLQDRKNNKMEKSILDYFIVCQDFFQLITKMCVDESKKFVLTKYTKVRGIVKVIESDHIPLYLEVNLPWEAKVKNPRVEIFNLRNNECQVKYQESTNNSDILTKCLINNDIKMGGKLWLKCMKNVIYENFRKIRINGKSPKDKQIQELYEKRSQAEQ